MDDCSLRRRAETQPQLYTAAERVRRLLGSMLIS